MRPGLPLTSGTRMSPCDLRRCGAFSRTRHPLEPPAMQEQFGEPDVFQACGYGVPRSRSCPSVCGGQGHGDHRGRDAKFGHLSNGLEESRQRGLRHPVPSRRGQRVMKVFRMPASEESSPGESRSRRGAARNPLLLRLSPAPFERGSSMASISQWDMQGPQETEDEFLERINDLLRERDGSGKKITKKRKPSFPWAIGINRRSRGYGPEFRAGGRRKASLLAGAKLIAVCPVLGWWERREGHENEVDALLASSYRSWRRVSLRGRPGRAACCRCRSRSDRVTATGACWIGDPTCPAVTPSALVLRPLRLLRPPRLQHLDDDRVQRLPPVDGDVPQWRCGGFWGAAASTRVSRPATPSSWQPRFASTRMTTC